MEEKKHSMPNPEDMGKILDVVSEKIPGLIKSIKDLIYSPEAGKEMGQAVGNFYKELVTSGLDASLASELTRDYLQALQKIGKGINNVNVSDASRQH